MLFSHSISCAKNATMVILLARPLNSVILDDSDRPNMSVQMNRLHLIYSSIAI